MFIPTIENSLEYQADLISDYFADAIYSVEPVHYSIMSDIQQSKVKQIFFASIKQSPDIEVTSELIRLLKAQYPTSQIAFVVAEYLQTITPKHTEALQTLTEDRKVTLIKFCEFGFPTLVHTTINRSEAAQYAQYKDSLFIYHTPKRKRTTYRTIICPYQELLVYDGWINFDIDSISKVTLKDNQFVTIQKSKYTSFDKQFLTDALEVIPQKPILYIKPEGK